MPENKIYNSNHRTIRNGYKKIAKALGSKYGVYRPVSNDVPVTDVRNWQFDIYFSNTLNVGYQTPKEFGLPVYKGYFDNTDVITGDFLYDENRTFYVADIPVFEPAVTIECFDTCTISSRKWDSATRSFIQEVIVNGAPCNVQPNGTQTLNRDPESHSEPDHLHKWRIHTYLHDQSAVSLNDLLVDSKGNKSYITQIVRTQHGHEIECVEIKNDPAPL